MTEDHLPTELTDTSATDPDEERLPHYDIAVPADPKAREWSVFWGEELGPDRARINSVVEGDPYYGDRVERIQVDLVRDARGIRVEQAEYITCTRTWYPNGWGFWDCFSQVIGRTRIHLK
jgi:hypothetical protein